MTDYRKVIFDSSVFITLVTKEYGWEQIQKLVPKAVMSAVNVAEVTRYFIERKGITKDQVSSIINKIIDTVVAFEQDQAYLSAEIVHKTKLYGLSLGDRACISLGLLTGYPIYTADQVWKKLAIPNLNIELIREITN